MGHAFITIRRECTKHGLPISHTAVLQAICLETLSGVFGGLAYETEWNDHRFVNPETGRRLRFDGYFPSLALLVEFHGYQHWAFPNIYHETAEKFQAAQYRDSLKVDLARADGLKLLVVREDEPYADPAYLRGRLINEGYLAPGK